MSVSEEKIIDAYKKYAPKNMAYEQFKKQIIERPELLDGMGNFSTFNMKLSQAKKDQISDDDMRNMLKDSLDKNVMENRTQEFANMYSDIICSNDDILESAWTFDVLTVEQREKLAQRIIEEMNKRLEIDQKIKISYFKSKSQQPFKELLKEFFVKTVIKLSNIFKHTNYSFPKYSGQYRSREKSIVLFNLDNFFNFISLLSHEYGHFIDDNYPDLGLLGAQISKYGDDVYSSIEGDEIYRANPTEISSYKIGATVEKFLYDKLLEQARKNPNRYAKALEKVLAKYKMDFAAMKIKYSKIFKNIDKAEKEYQTAKSEVQSKIVPNFEEKYTEYFQISKKLRGGKGCTPQEKEIYENFQTVLWESNNKANEDPKVKKKFEKIQLAKKEIPLEYKQTESFIRIIENMIDICNLGDKEMIDHCVNINLR